MSDIITDSHDQPKVDQEIEIKTSEMSLKEVHQPDVQNDQTDKLQLHVDTFSPATDRENMIGKETDFLKIKDEQQDSKTLSQVKIQASLSKDKMTDIKVTLEDDLVEQMSEQSGPKARMKQMISGGAMEVQTPHFDKENPYDKDKVDQNKQSYLSKIHQLNMKSQSSSVNSFNMAPQQTKAENPFEIRPILNIDVT